MLAPYLSSGSRLFWTAGPNSPEWARYRAWWKTLMRFSIGLPQWNCREDVSKVLYADSVEPRTVPRSTEFRDFLVSSKPPLTSLCGRVGRKIEPAGKTRLFMILVYPKDCYNPSMIGCTVY